METSSASRRSPTTSGPSTSGPSRSAGSTSANSSSSITTARRRATRAADRYLLRPLLRSVRSRLPRPGGNSNKSLAAYPADCHPSGVTNVSTIRVTAQRFGPAHMACSTNPKISSAISRVLRYSPPAWCQKE